MMSFKDFIIESMDGTYVSVRFNKKSNKVLADLRNELAVPNPLQSNKFHSTVLFSRKPIDVPLGTTKIHAYMTNSLLLKEWKGNNGKTALVATYESKYLTDSHNYFRALGGTHDFPDYTPHITLSYDIGDNVGMYNGKVIILNSSIIANKQIIEPLDLDWV